MERLSVRPFPAEALSKIDRDAASIEHRYIDPRGIAT